jgi:hypothetical protein
VEPTTVERTIIKETTVIVPAPAAAPSPAQAPSSSTEAQQVAGSESVAPEVEIPIEIDIPHDGTVVPCSQDPVCSSEQARIQNEHVAELEAAKTDGLPPSQNLPTCAPRLPGPEPGYPRCAGRWADSRRRLRSFVNGRVVLFYEDRDERRMGA